MRRVMLSFVGITSLCLGACGDVIKGAPSDGGASDGGVDAAEGLRVVSTIPANGETAVAVDLAIVITVTEDLDPNTVTPSTVLLSDPDGAAIQATVTYESLTITVTPIDRLPGNAFITATMTTAVRDLAGNSLETDFSWTFETDYGTEVIYGLQEFTVRDTPVDGNPDVFVGGAPPPRLLFIKKGTEDRAIVEFDIERYPVDIFSAQLDFHSHTLDPLGASTRLEVYTFDGNGVPDLADFSRTQALLASDFGSNEATDKPHSFDVTAVLRDARQRGVRFFGLLWAAEDTDDRFDLDVSTDNPNTAPRLTIVY